MRTLSTSSSSTDNNFLTNDKALVSDGSGDYFFSDDGDDMVRASSGNDTIHGDDGDDTLYGEGGDDEINGENNNDTLFGGSGGDELNGGSGIDEVMYMSSSAGVTVNLSTNFSSGGHASGDTISGFEDLSGSGFDDTLTGTSGANYISGSSGEDVIDGLGGVDALYGGSGDDVIEGGDGSDYDHIQGGPGSDTLIGGGGDDYIEGDYGDRTPDQIPFDDLTYYSDGEDDLDTDDDVLEGGTGDDTLDGGSGDDTLDGGAGEDTIIYSTMGAIFVSLDDGTAAGGAEGDTFISIEDVTGSAPSIRSRGTMRRIYSTDTLTATSSKDLEATTPFSAATARTGLRAAAARTGLRAATTMTSSTPTMGPRRASFSCSTATICLAKAVMTRCTAGTATTGWRAARTPTTRWRRRTIRPTTIFPPRGWSFRCPPERRRAAMRLATPSSPSRTSGVPHTAGFIDGDGGANELYGLGDSDTLKGLGGADTLYGGTVPRRFPLRPGGRRHVVWRRWRGPAVRRFWERYGCLWNVGRCGDDFIAQRNGLRRRCSR